MTRISDVTRAASGFGAVSARRLPAQGDRVTTADLRETDVIADLATL